MMNAHPNESTGSRGHKDIHDIHSNTQLNLLPMIRNDVSNGASPSKTQNHNQANIDKTLNLNNNDDNTSDQYPQLVVQTISPKSQFVPPLNFSLVEDSIYRSGFPMPINYPFLKHLGIKTIIYLGDLGNDKKAKKDKAKKKDKDKKKEKEDNNENEEDGEKKEKKKDKHGTIEIMSNYKKWLSTTDIEFHHLVTESSQEPFLLQERHEQCQRSLKIALELVLNKQNFPILIHSNKGKHRIGVLVGLMRKILQGWCMSGIFEEYEKFAMGKSEFDLEFIEIWQPELQYDEDYLPNFVRKS